MKIQYRINCSLHICRVNIFERQGYIVNSSNKQYIIQVTGGGWGVRTESFWNRIDHFYFFLNSESNNAQNLCTHEKRITAKLTCSTFPVSSKSKRKLQYTYSNVTTTSGSSLSLITLTIRLCDPSKYAFTDRCKTRNRVRRGLHRRFSLATLMHTWAQ